ncbi:MAG: pitrilysin family protein [Bacteroidota bacterium]
MNRAQTLLPLLCLLCAAVPRAAGEEGIPTDALVLLPVRNDPTVSFRIWFRAGSQDDPAGKEGLAALSAAMLMDASTRNNRYEQILEKLYPLASSYDASTSVEMTVLSGRTHRDNLAEYYPLFLDAILRPAFLQEDLDRIRSQVLNYLENQLRYSSDEELGKALLYGDIFAGTPYGHIPQGTVEAVRSITLEDIRGFYARHFTRQNLVVGLTGGYDEALVGALRKDLWAFPAGAPPAVPPPSPRPIKGLLCTIVEKDAPATAISMGFPIGVLRGSREWYALAIANSWLGEHRNSSSHLYQVIREARGLNYGDYSYIEHFPNGGRLQMPPQNVARRRQIFEIWIRPVPNETRHFALRAAVRELRDLWESGMSEEEFNLTRGFLRKYALHYAPTSTERLGYALDDRFYGITGSHLETFRTMMTQITREEVNAAIRKHLNPASMRIAVVTKDAVGFRDALVGDAPSPITYATPKPQEVLDEDKVISVYPLTVRAEDVRIVTVQDLFAR